MKQYAIILSISLLAVQVFGQEGDQKSSFSLKEAIEYAKENSFDARSAQLEIEAAERNVKATASMGLPQVSAEGGFKNFIQIPQTPVPATFINPMADPNDIETVAFGTEYNVSGSITASQLIFDGSYFVGLQAAKASKEYYSVQAEKSEADVIKAVTTAYYNSVVAEENHSILTQNRDNVASILKETEALFENGFAEETDVDQFKLTLTDLENSITNAKRQKELSYQLLKFQMGLEQGDELTLTDDLDALMTFEQSPEFLSKDFSPSKHVEMRLMLTSVHLQELNLKNTRTGFMPSVSAFINHQEQVLANELTFDKWIPSTVWGINLNVPIFTSFGTYNKVQQARIEMDKMTLRKEQVEEQLKLGAQQTKIDYMNALAVLESRKESMKLAKRISERMLVKYKEGLSSSLDYTQAQNQYLTAEGNYINALFQVLQAKAALDKAYGNYNN